MDILEIEIHTNNIIATEKFYHGILGLPVISKAEEYILLKAGSSVLGFRKSDTENPVYHFAFDIPPNLLTEALRWTVERVNVIRPSEGEAIVDFENWSAKAFYFYDNNSNIVEFIARYGIAEIRDEPFDGNTLLNISEVGIISHQPLEMAEKLNMRHSLDYFHRGPKREDFAPIGDDKGLLILSKEGRHWYPTTIPGHRFYTRIVIRNEIGIEEIIVQ